MSTVQIFETTDFEPDEVKVLGDVFDDVWTTINPRFTGRETGEIQAARAALAQRIIWLAKHGHRDPTTLKEMSLSTLRVVTRSSASGS